MVLTTHYIEEAERLCDRVAIIDEGKIVAIGTPRELQQKSAERSRIDIVCGQPMNACHSAAMARCTGKQAGRRWKIADGVFVAPGTDIV